MCVGRLVLTYFYLSTSKASPNDVEIVIVIIIAIISEAKLIFHDGGIIAQDYLSRAGRSFAVIPTSGRLYPAFIKGATI